MLIHADARALPVRDACVQCVVTSPPYWGLRDYGVRGQIGLELTPAAFVAEIVTVFREVRRVLKDDGVCWLNLGDCYATGAGKVGDCPGGGEQGARWKGYRGTREGDPKNKCAMGPLVQPNRMPIEGLKPKDLVGIPWRVAFALQADGWYLRADVIWSKPNPMPESVTDRPTKAHEYLFLLTKSERYYYDAAAIKEPATDTGRVNGREGRKEDPAARPPGTSPRTLARLDWTERGRNKRSVWTVPTMPYSGAHFATMPEKLVEPCILAGSRHGDLVFDPFIGSGTVGAVASRLGRRWAGTDLNRAYHELARKRTAQGGLMFDAVAVMEAGR